MDFSRDICLKENTRTRYKYITNEHKLLTNGALNCRLTSLIHYIQLVKINTFDNMNPEKKLNHCFQSHHFCWAAVKSKTEQILVGI